jgi:hypothetical protein
MLLDISVYFQSFIECIDHNQRFCTNCVKKIKHFLCCKRNFLDVHVMKLYAPGCNVISHWNESTVTTICIQFV